MLNECSGCEYQCKLSHIDICTLGSPCPNQRSTPMTNEEWIRNASTEELAEFLNTLLCMDSFCEICSFNITCGIGDTCEYAEEEITEDELDAKKCWLKWLQEKHQ